jgi:hypothetical protein
MSSGITTTILAGLLLTTCVTARGCGGRARDYSWYDAHGHRITENWKTDATGKRVPDPYPHDRYGRPWVYDENGNLVPQEPPAGARHRSGSGGLFLWGGSGYRSGSSGTSYRSGGGSSSISRGGFGSTGMGGGG